MPPCHRPPVGPAKRRLSVFFPFYFNLSLDHLPSTCHIQHVVKIFQLRYPERSSECHSCAGFRSNGALLRDTHSGQDDGPAVSSIVYSTSRTKTHTAYPMPHKCIVPVGDRLAKSHLSLLAPMPPSMNTHWEHTAIQTEYHEQLSIPQYLQVILRHRRCEGASFGGAGIPKYLILPL